MKKTLLFILFAAIAAFATAQPVCPPGGLTQNAKWNFVRPQCMDSTLRLKYNPTDKVAYMDANGDLRTITFAALLDSLNIPAPDSVKGSQWSIQYNDSGELMGSNNFLYNGDLGVFYIRDFNNDTLFSVNTQTREVRVRGTLSVHLPDSIIPTVDGNGNLTGDSVGLVWKGNGIYLLNRNNAVTAQGALIITGNVPSTSRITQSIVSNTASSGPVYQFFRGRGTLTSPSVPVINNVLGEINFGVYDGTAFVSGTTRIRCLAGGTATTTSSPAYIQFTTNDANATQFSTFFTQKGGVSIKGSNGDSIAELTINGTTLTGTQDYNSIRILQTWNTSGNPTGIFANYTNTSSGATTKLIDLQTDGTTRFNVLKTGEATFASLVNATAFIATTSGNGFIIAGGGRLKAPDGNGIFEITNVTENGFNRINFGDNTSAFPSLKRNAAGLQVRNGDDSGYGTLESGTFSVNGSPNASAAVTINSTTQGFLPPVMTATQGSAIASPATGLLIYVTNTNGTFTSTGWWGFNGSAWEKLNN